MLAFRVILRYLLFDPGITVTKHFKNVFINPKIRVKALKLYNIALNLCFYLNMNTALSQFLT